MSDTPLPEPTAAFVGIGSNLADPRCQVEAAIHALGGLPQTQLTCASRLYRTAPVGPQDQPHFVNAVVRLATRLTPQALLAALQQVERARGRVRDGTRWGPRILDLDLLIYGDSDLDLPGLRVPHPEMHRRAFVLIPLADVAPSDLVVPGRGPLAALLSRVARDGVDALPPRTAGASPIAALS